jgi:hypothetical protein
MVEEEISIATGCEMLCPAVSVNSPDRASSRCFVQRSEEEKVDLNQRYKQGEVSQYVPSADSNPS